MTYSQRQYEINALLAVIHPDLHLGTYYTEWVRASDYHCLTAELYVGDLGQAATIDLEMQQATDSAGTGAKAVVSGAAITKAITQLTQAGGDGDDSCCIECRSEELDAMNNFCWVRLRLDALVAGSNVGAVLRGWFPRYIPVPNNWTEAIAS